MFSSLFFLIIVMLVVNISLESDLQPLLSSPLVSLEVGLLAYILILILIYLQIALLSRGEMNKGLLSILINIELVTFLAFFHFVLVAPLFFQQYTFFKEYQTPLSLFSLLMYFAGLGVFYLAFYRFKRRKDSLLQTWTQLRFLLPFVLPFLFFTAILDLAKALPIRGVSEFITNTSEDPLISLILFLVSIVFMVVMMIFLPLLIQGIWGCEDLKDKQLESELEEICQKAHFKHAGFKVWKVMSDALTAGIIGIVPRYRYILFTQRLLDCLPLNSIKAILAHEIGHSYRKHLLIYPFIIFGMLIACGLFSLVFSEGLTRYFELTNLLNPSPLWEILEVFMVFIPYALIIALYFRFVFGYFSRTFERQADLHGFFLNLPPESMVDALNAVAIATGHSHKQPSWHHYSIQERMDFLEKAQKTPSIITRHHRKAKLSLILYLVALLACSTLILAPLFPNWPPVKGIAEVSATVSRKFNNWITGSLRQEAAQNLMQKHSIATNNTLIKSSFEKSLAIAPSLEPGISEFYAAALLAQEHHASEAALVLTLAWQQLDVPKTDQETIDKIIKLSKNVLPKLNQAEASSLRKSIEEAFKNSKGR